MSEPFPQSVEPIPDWQQPSPRPTSVTVIAIIGIIYASLGLLCQAFGLVSAAAVRAPNMATQIINSSISIVLSLILLPASIGLLYLKPAARRVLLGWSIVAIIFVTARAIWSIFYVIPNTDMNAAPNMPTSMPANFSPAAFKAMAMGSVGVSWILTIALPIALLIILTRPRVRDVFLRPASAP